jgi:hypothetical protein
LSYSLTKCKSGAKILISQHARFSSKCKICYITILIAFCERAFDALVPTWVKKLLLNLDNASSTNKNKYTIGSLAICVLVGRFDHIKISLMIVGHTKVNGFII